MIKRELGKIRERIDITDAKIRLLLEKRFSLALSAVRFKKNLRDLRREKEIIRNCQRGLRNKVLKDCFKKIYIEILRQSVVFQKKNAHKNKQRRVNKKESIS